jgi:hypothetical protein
MLGSTVFSHFKPVDNKTQNNFFPIKECQFCQNWKYCECQLGYHVKSTSKPCRQGTARTR